MAGHRRTRATVTDQMATEAMSVQGPETKADKPGVVLEKKETNIAPNLTFVQTNSGCFFKAGVNGNVPTCMVNKHFNSAAALLKFYNEHPNNYGTSAIRLINMAFGIEGKTDSVAPEVFTSIAKNNEPSSTTAFAPSLTTINESPTEPTKTTQTGLEA